MSWFLFFYSMEHPESPPPPKSEPEVSAELPPPPPPKKKWVDNWLGNKELFGVHGWTKNLKTQLCTYMYLGSEGRLILPLSVAKFDGLCMQFEEKQLCTLVSWYVLHRWWCLHPLTLELWMLHICNACRRALALFPSPARVCRLQYEIRIKLPWKLNGSVKGSGINMYFSVVWLWELDRKYAPGSMCDVAWFCLGGTWL